MSQNRVAFPRNNPQRLLDRHRAEDSHRQLESLSLGRAPMGSLSLAVAQNNLSEEELAIDPHDMNFVVGSSIIRRPACRLVT